MKTLEVIEETVIPSNKDFFLNCPGNHNAVEAINTFKEQVLGVLLRCTVKDCRLQFREWNDLDEHCQKSQTLLISPFSIFECMPLNNYSYAP